MPDANSAAKYDRCHKSPVESGKNPRGERKTAALEAGGDGVGPEGLAARCHKRRILQSMEGSQEA